MADEDLSASLTFQRGASRVGLERVALLEAVDELGSISAAARQLGLSYKGAWAVVQALNALFGDDLIAAAPGGKSGGVTALTPRGQAAVLAFRRLQAEIDNTLARLQSHVAAPTPDPLLSLGMRTSARNALRGTVAAIEEGPVSAEVIVDIGEGPAVVSRLTRQSVDRLGLAVGAPVVALIKANFVVLSPNQARTTARNHFPGAVASREDGVDTSEIAVDIGGGRTLVATTTRQEAEDLAFAPGAPATALFKPAHVILATE